jgi:tRNA A-37 threonylcarbamoyl transferase component Bud32
MICRYCQAPNAAAAEACFTCGRALSALTQGDVIAGRYDIESVLGKGGMGMVYRAHDRMLDETVAIKVLRGEFANTAEMLRRFKHEIKLARRVSHRNVCRIHEFGEDEDSGIRYISMEYVEGADMKQLARDNGGFLEPDDAFDVTIQAAEGLQAIHEVDIIHRDLKASNIMRDPRGRVRLMDFGIAKMEAMDHSSGGGLTIAGMTMGTPEYMSPEQCMAEKIDWRSDIYSLGVVAYELFTGSVPFRGDTPVATLYKHLNEPVPLETPGAARIPAAAVPVLRKALAKNKEDRYASAAAMAEALRTARQKTREALVAEAAPTARVAAVPGAASGVVTPAPTPPDRRRATRLETPVNFMLRRVGSAAQVLQEERTVAENIGRGGARVFTSISSLAPGDIVQLEQVDGPFKTRAEVRGTYIGKDRVRRLNLRFLDSPAPDYLVHVDETR